jgi:membrane protein DedA with SNARE-associated domain
VDFLTGLHGAVATILICVLLFIDEAGVPLPFIPNEVLLIVAGLLIAAGSLNPFIFYPIACLALFGGSFSGYSWAKRVGPKQLRRVAGMLHATKAYDRATRRLANADARHLALSRVIPGIRVYATLCAGSAQVPARTFWEANVPAILGWVEEEGYLAVRFVVGVGFSSVSPSSGGGWPPGSHCGPRTVSPGPRVPRIPVRAARRARPRPVLVGPLAADHLQDFRQRNRGE